jgi:capsular polysaccharide transport system permease protein
MSDNQDSKTREGGNNPGAVVLQPERPAGKLRKGQGFGRNLAAGRKLEPSAPLQPAEPAASLLSSGGEAAHYTQLLLDMQRSRKRRLLLRLVLFVGLPTLLTFLYTFFWAAPRYVSEFEVTYQVYQPLKSLSSGLLESVLGTSQTSNIDIGAIVYEYARSPAALAKLDSKLNLKEYYSHPNIDYFSRLSPSASREKFLSYFRRRVSVSEGLGGYLKIEVTAFDPQYALALAKAVVQACDEMVDSISSRARKNEVRSAEAEVARQEERIRNARKALTTFQNAHGDLDPQRVATQLGQIVGNIESQLATARTELANTLGYMRADAPRVIQLKYLISALEQQLRQEQGRLANTGGATPYSQILDQYSALQLEEDFASKAYLAAQQGLALARADAARQQAYLVDFAPPSESDRATQSFPQFSTLAAFLVSLLTFGIGSLMIGALRDQAGI